jgi:hypothetical protein
MANTFTDLYSEIDTYIKANGNNEITGPQMRSILLKLHNILVNELSDEQVPFYDAATDKYQGNASFKFDSTNARLILKQMILEVGDYVNQIYNSGTFTGVNSKTLITKRYHDSFHNIWQPPVNYAIATPVSVSNLMGGQTVAGYTLVAGDFVLLTNQASPAENGPYKVSAAGGSGGSRPEWWDASFLPEKMLVPVITGDNNLIVMKQVEDGGTATFVEEEIQTEQTTRSDFTFVNNFLNNL